MLSIFCLMTLFSITAAPAHAFSNGDENAAGGLVVLELFTSQGCNSCPPADDILAAYSRRDNILALSFSVDYWNYLGWKDTLAQPDCTERQKKYNAALGKSGVYTPQLIIQGAQEVVGSKKERIDAIVTATFHELKNRRQTAPRISFAPVDDMIELWIGAGENAENATIWIIGYDFEKTVKIRGGELKGQVRSYHNVVRSIKRVGSWMGQEIKLTLSEDDLGGGGHDAYALLLQQGEVGPILTAARLHLK